MKIDVRAELADFPWIRATWSDTRLIAASPWRYDRQPSFYVILDEDDPAYGSWGDSGADDPEFQRGGIVRLLAFLRDETIGETLEYLRDKYGGHGEEKSDELALNLPKLYVPDKPRVTRIDSAILDAYRFRSPYLGSRGISEEVQRLMSIGYDRQRRAVTIPWFNADGSLGNVKYRRTDSKTFWYERGGRPIREMVYGINITYERKLKRAAIVEAEVDALTLMSAGIFAIATGGTALNREKAELILRSPIEELMLFRDRDAAGRAWRNRIVAELKGAIDLRVANVARPYKDVNEWACAVNCGACAVDEEPIRRSCERARAVRKLANFQLIT
ncbi:toprim domain-containing protein [Cohnella silvisoli]|uniref:Toprim domain-containing protein n=1 Tax=Cohnella silvisoli TaxID=2873699 RepID=A0ABV1KYR3_9BACL|nr:toprim domain-containing protein [Cohnella silvisoli]MCD9024365.1 toprim domain-containing protein [Cohnella silvisoli]